MTWFKRTLLIIGIILTLLIAAGTSYGYYVYQQAETTVEEMNTSFEEHDDEFEENGLPDSENNHTNRNEENDDDISDNQSEFALDEEPVTFLLTGIGDRPNDPGRADVIMAVSVNPKTDSTLMFNIPRDTLIEESAVVDSLRGQKINHTYATEGINGLQTTVENYLDHEFDFTIKANMNGFREIVDEIGPIEVNNDFAFSESDEVNDQTYDYDEGLIELDGERALHYVRMRKEDPRGDLGRNERQHQVMEALIEEGMSLQSLFQAGSIIEILGDNIETNMTFDEMQGVFNHHRSAAGNIETFELRGENEYQNGTYYYIISEEERERAGEELKRHQEGA
ncbi:LytR family transcriptional attenuator [Salsuginibacillus halophilus]|uniref:LytR family transcriptional attenuator n=1 Tax=Salsuginibacillus halophilus TaxID=517424 RepID=A0A2P8HXP8_9BACI|nr:LCP family protein [Salsuginibacillus halophilus]PSL50990.1 LytR family transcriptional attenuator [Salsuginibacillus halophilus]